ncbi:MAG: AAA family ATPase [Bryobacteraceae bacterium]
MKAPPEPDTNLRTMLAARVLGQPEAMRSIVPYVEMYQAGLSPEGRPAGVFLLLGPTGTGKTRTVEALAEVLHGSDKHMLRVDCGEFQMEHEVAKLIGAPPGYLGHRETQPILTQTKLNGATSEHSGLALVLFDEIEKAAASMQRLLLGILDKGTLRLGDNSTVNFERTLIFLTSNLGAKSMRKELFPDFGFEAIAEREGIGPEGRNSRKKIEAIGLKAVKNKFSPEFVNRIDAVIAYEPLSDDTLAGILDQQIDALQGLIFRRLEDRAFEIGVTEAGRRFLLDQGTSTEYGARELKRTIHRKVVQPLAMLVSANRIPPASRIVIDLAADGSGLRMRFAA